MSIERRLPKSFVEENSPREDGKEATFMGIPFRDLTREELEAVAINGWKTYERLLGTNISRRRLL